MSAQELGDKELVIDHSHKNANNLFVELCLNFYAGIYTLYQTKLAHLPSEHPFLIRIKVVLYYIVYYLTRYLQLLVPNIEVATLKRKKQKLAQRAVRLFGHHNDTSKKEPIMSDYSSKSQRSGLNEFSASVLQLSVVSAGGNFAGLNEFVQEEIEKLRQRVEEENDISKKFTIIHQELGVILKKCKCTSNFIFTEQLGCRLLVEEKVNMLISEKRDLGQTTFDFTELASLLELVAEEVELFTEVTKDTKIDNFRPNEIEFREYCLLLVEVLNRKALDPFGVLALAVPNVGVLKPSNRVLIELFFNLETKGDKNFMHIGRKEEKEKLDY